MQKMLSFAVGIAALTLASVAAAQFDGPAPLAWRWQQSSTTAPGGSPLVLGDTIYQSLGGRVFSLDKDTGNLKWRFPAVDPMEGSFRSAPILSAGTLVAACDNKLIVGIDPVTGDSKWTYETPAAVYGQPIQVGKFVVAALSDNTIVAINPVDGSPIWSAPYKMYDGVQGFLGAFGDDILVCTANFKLIALNVATRKFDWTRQFSQLPPAATPVVLGDRIYITSGPYLVALSAVSGFPMWQVDTGMQLAFAPACSASGIMVVSVDGQAKLYDLNRTLLTKKPLDLGSVPITRPTPVGSKFIVPTSNGGIVLVDPASGKKIWNYVIHPIDETVRTASTTGSQAGGKGGRGGGPGAGGAGGGGVAGGGSFSPGGAGGGAGGQNSKKDDKVYFVQASAPAVLDGQTLLIPAKDGSLLAFDSTLGVDLTPPTSKMLFPNPGEQVNGLPPLVLLFKVEDDDSGVNKDSLKIDVDGHNLDYTFTKEGLILVRFSTTGNNQSLPNGRHNFTVTVSDWMGNEGKTTYALIIDNLLPKIILPGQEENKNGQGRGGLGKGGGGGFGGGAGGDDQGGG